MTVLCLSPCGSSGGRKGRSWRLIVLCSVCPCVPGMDSSPRSRSKKMEGCLWTVNWHFQSGLELQLSPSAAAAVMFTCSCNSNWDLVWIMSTFKHLNNLSLCCAFLLECFWQLIEIEIIIFTSSSLQRNFLVDWSFFPPNCLIWDTE